MTKIFISYRRSDAGFATDRLYEELKQYVDDPRTDIFLDVDGIPPGVDFEAHLQKMVAACDVLFAVIGSHWLEERDDSGQRRIDSNMDFVHIEIATALSRGIRVVPILLGGCAMPTANELPGPLKTLPKRQGVAISRSNFSSDVRSLLSKMNIHARGIEKPRPTNSEDIRSKPANVGRLLIATMLGLLVGVASTFAWSNSQNQQTLHTMQEELVAERNNFQALEAQLNASRTLSGALPNYKKIAALENQIAKAAEILNELELHYRNSSTPGLNRSETWIDAPVTDWDQFVEVRLEEMFEDYASRVDNYNRWANARVVEPPVDVCLPKNPYRERPPQPGCPD